MSQAFRTMMSSFDTLDIVDERKQKLKSWWDVRKNRDKVMMACMALFALAIILAVLKRDALMSNPIQAVQEMGMICVRNMSKAYGG